MGGCSGDASLVCFIVQDIAKWDRRKKGKRKKSGKWGQEEEEKRKKRRKGIRTEERKRWNKIRNRKERLGSGEGERDEVR